MKLWKYAFVACWGFSISSLWILFVSVERRNWVAALFCIALFLSPYIALHLILRRRLRDLNGCIPAIWWENSWVQRQFRGPWLKAMTQLFVPMIAGIAYVQLSRPHPDSMVLLMIIAFASVLHLSSFVVLWISLAHNWIWDHPPLGRPHYVFMDRFFPEQDAAKRWYRSQPLIEWARNYPGLYLAVAPIDGDGEEPYGVIAIDVSRERLLRRFQILDEAEASNGRRLPVHIGYPTLDQKATKEYTQIYMVTRPGGRFPRSPPTPSLPRWRTMRLR